MVELEEDVFEIVGTSISVISHRLARKYRSYTTADDIAQDLWLWVLARPSRTRGVRKAADGDDLKKEVSYLERNLYRAGDIQCRKEKAKVSGYRHTDEYFYSTQLIADLIQAWYHGVGLERQASDDRVRRKRTLSQGFEMESMVSDVQVGLDALSESQQAVVLSVFGAGMSVKEIADDLGVTRQAVEQRLDRAVEKMIEALGGPSPY